MQNAAIRLLGLNRADQAAGRGNHLRPAPAGDRLDEDRRHQPRPREIPAEHSALGRAGAQKIGLVLINVNITDIRTSRATSTPSVRRPLQGDSAGAATWPSKRRTARFALPRPNATSSSSGRCREVEGNRDPEAEREQAVRIAELEKEQRSANRQPCSKRDAGGRRRSGPSVSRSPTPTPRPCRRNRSQAEVAGSQAELPVRKAEAYQVPKRRSAKPKRPCSKSRTGRWPTPAIADAERSRPNAGPSSKRPRRPKRRRSSSKPRPRPKAAPGSRGRGIGHLRQARSRGPRPVRNSGQEGRGLEAIIDACGGASKRFSFSCSSTSTTWPRRPPRRSRTSSSTRWSCGKGGAQNGQTATTSFLQSFARTLPPMMQIMKDIGGVEVPEYLARLSPENGAVPVASTVTGSNGAGSDPAHAPPVPEAPTVAVADPPRKPK